MFSYWYFYLFPWWIILRKHGKWFACLNIWKNLGCWNPTFWAMIYLAFDTRHRLIGIDQNASASRHKHMWTARFRNGCCPFLPFYKILWGHDVTRQQWKKDLGPKIKTWLSNNIYGFIRFITSIFVWFNRFEVRHGWVIVSQVLMNSIP